MWSLFYRRFAIFGCHISFINKTCLNQRHYGQDIVFLSKSYRSTRRTEPKLSFSHVSKLLTWNSSAYAHITRQLNNDSKSRRKIKKNQTANIIHKEIVDETIQRLLIDNKKWCWVLINPNELFVHSLITKQESFIVVMNELEKDIRSINIKDIEQQYTAKITTTKKKRLLRFDFFDFLNNFSAQTNAGNNLRIVCLLSNCATTIKFINMTLNYFISYPENILRKKDIELVCLFSEKHFNIHTSYYPPKRAQSYSLFGAVSNFLLECTEIRKISVKDIEPSPVFTRPLKWEKINQMWKNDSIYLVNVKVKPEFKSVDPDTISQFYFFLNILLKNKTARLIPKLEVWFPDCGIQMIKLNFSMLHCVKDLTPVEYWNLFQTIKNWPEFKQSGFLSAYERTIESRVGHSDHDDIE